MRSESIPGHSCHIYRDVADRAHQLTLFLSEGLREKAQCRVIAYTHSPDRAVGALAGAGFDIAQVLYNEALDVIPAASTPLLALPFDANAAVEWLREQAGNAREGGFTSLRVAIEMRWALSSSVGETGLAAFERGLNRLAQEVPVNVLCQYDAGAFPPMWVDRAARMHQPVQTAGAYGAGIRE
jgi:hypothetical protein